MEHQCLEHVLHQSLNQKDNDSNNLEDITYENHLYLDAEEFPLALHFESTTLSFELPHSQLGAALRSGRSPGCAEMAEIC